MPQTNIDVTVSEDTASTTVGGSSATNVSVVTETASITSPSTLAASVAMAGEQGPVGPSGGQGPSGDDGPQGETGPSGATGVSVTGVSGSGTASYFLLNNSTSIGPVNIQGPSGNTGHAGGQGEQGDQGIQGPSGATGVGVAGPTGPTGHPGGESYFFKFNSSINDVDPGAGKIKFNNATYSNTTALYIDNLDQSGDSLSVWKATLDDVIGSRIRIYAKDDPTKWIVFKISGTSTSKSGYTAISVYYLDHSDTFSNDEDIVFTFAPAAVGPVGSQGIQGEQGDSITGAAGGGTGTYFLISNGSNTNTVNIQGPSGATGATGIFGGDAQAFVFSTNTSNSDPGDTYFRLSNSDPLKSSGLLVDHLDYNSVNVSGWLGSFAAADKTGDIGKIKLTSISGSNNFISLQVTGNPSHSKSGYLVVPITGIATGRDHFYSGEVAVLSFSKTGPIGVSGLSGLRGMSGISGESGISGMSGTGPMGPMGPTGDFGGESFSFAYNSGWNNDDAPGTYAIKFGANMEDQGSEPNLLITAPTGIYLSRYNYNSGTAQDWVLEFGNHGDSGNRGILKVWTRGQPNLSWATFRITGQGQYPVRGSNDSRHISVPVWPLNSQDYFIHEGNFPESGEVVVTINHAGPTGQAGVGGGGAGGSPATGYAASLQFHAPFKHEEGGTSNPLGTLTGSNILFEGMNYGPIDAQNEDQHWGHSNQFGIGTEFQELTKRENLQPDNEFSALYLPEMSGLVDIRGTVAVSGEVLSYPSHIPYGFIDPYGSAYVEAMSLGTIFNWWPQGWIDHLSGQNINAQTGMFGHINSQVITGEVVGGAEVTGTYGNFETVSATNLQVDVITDYTMPEWEIDAGVYIDANFLPYQDMMWSLGSYEYTWFDVYTSSATIKMSGGNMTGWGEFGMNDKGELTVGVPGATGAITESGVFLTGVDASTVATLKLSGAGATGNTVLSSTPDGTIKIQIPGQTGDEASTIATGISNTEVSSPSGTFSSGIDAGDGTVAIDESGLNFCGMFQESIEDLGQWTDTGHNVFKTGYATDRLEISFTGRSLKTLELKHHATRLKIKDAQPGRTMAIRISGGAPAVPDGDITAYQFLSGNDLNFLGVEPVALKIGKIGLLSITAFGTGDSSCFATWAETDYNAV